MITVKAFKTLFLVKGQKAQVVECLTGALGDSIRPHDLYKITSSDGSKCVHGHLILESCEIDKT